MEPENITPTENAPLADTGAVTSAPETSQAPPATESQDTQHWPTPAEARAAEEADLLGSVPRGTSAPAPAVVEKVADTPATTPPADTTPLTPNGGALTPATDAPAPAIFDFSKIAGGRYKDEAALTAALTAAEEATRIAANPQLQAMSAMLADPLKMSEFARVQAIDYAAQAVSDPKATLFDQFKVKNPQFSAETVGIRFEQAYEQQYKYLEYDDDQDPQYNQSVALRNEDARFAAVELADRQKTQREEMLAAVPVAAAPSTPAGPSDADVMAHVAAVNAAVLPAHMVQVGDVSVPVTVAPEVAAQVKEFATDVFSYFEQRGAVDADGKINVGKLQEFGLRLANYDAAVAAAAAQGNKAGFAAGVASLVNPGDSSTPAPNSANNQTQPTNQQVPTYWQNRQTAAEIDY